MSDVEQLKDQMVAMMTFLEMDEYKILGYPIMADLYEAIDYDPAKQKPNYMNPEMLASLVAGGGENFSMESVMPTKYSSFFTTFYKDTKEIKVSGQKIKTGTVDEIAVEKAEGEKEKQIFELLHTTLVDECKRKAQKMVINNVLTENGLDFCF